MLSNKSETVTDNANQASFDALYNSLTTMVEETDSLSDAADVAEINYALGYSDNTHDLAIAQQKADIALQYTVAVRDRFIEAYNTIMQMQI
ncbi:MAG: flagellar hook-basal body complex protein FliE [Eubacterium sp.]|nr:flagellar hook-basal body complex protein FliE [Eubacterium sp.]